MNITRVSSDEGHEEKVFVDGEECTVFKDEEGHEYVHVRNPYTGNRLLGFHFRPKDALECIKEGKADVMKGSADRLSAAYFLDREYGESVRNKTLEGWKNAEFTWGVVYRDRYILEDGSIYCAFLKAEEQAPIRKFKSKEKAQYWINAQLKKGKFAAETYLNGNEEEKEAIAGSYARASLDFEVFYNMVDEENSSVKDGKWLFRIAQVPVEKKEG